jgi:acyl-CoA-binding protein
MQGSQGDVHGDKPSIWNPNKKAIFEAWEKLKGMDMEEARKEYLIIAKE